VTEPPGAAPQTSGLPPQPTDPFTLDALLRDVKITDLAIALFALVVALFTWRAGTVSSRLRRSTEHQIEETRRVLEASESAAEAARRSAESAEQCLGVLRDTAERQLRAYVTVKQFIQNPAENVQGSLIQVVWQNTGATPTKGFRYWAMLREFDAAIPDDFDFTPPGLKDYAGGELGSSSTVSSPPLFASAQTISRMQDGTRKLLLLGQANYADFGGHAARRETRFCVEVVPAEVTGTAGAPFSFVYYPRHNYVT
jgi:hypothetical protein